MALNENIVIRLMADTSNYTTKMQAASAQAETMSKAMEKPMTTGQRMEAGFTKAGLAVGALSAAIGVAAVKSFMDFDASMSMVQANTGASGKEMNKLRDAAIEAGARTVYSATESADAINELAKAGMSTSDVLNGGLNGALDLAASDGMAVSEAAELMSSTLSQFNLTGKDATKVADALAAGAGKAQGDAKDLGYALSQSGMVAHSFGISMQETTGTLASFAHAGMIGSDAGTSLKSMLIALANPTKKAQQTMDDLGISAYDAQGNFVGLDGLAGQLQGSMKHLTVQQRNQALATIFGSDAVRAANVLYNEGTKGIDGWTKAVSDSGYASKQAAARNDNLKGDIEQLSGSMETAFIKIGEGANGPLRGLVQSITDVVNAFSNLDPHIQQTIVLAGMGAGAVAGLHKAFGDLSSSGSGVKQTLGLMLDPMERLKQGAPQLKDGLSQIAGAATGVGTGIGSMSGSLTRGQKAMSGLKSMGGGLVSMLGGPWGIAFTGAALALGVFASQQQAAKKQSDNLASALENGTSAAVQFKKNLETNTDTGWDFGDQFSTFIDSLPDALTAAGISFDTFSQAAAGSASATKEYKDQLLEAQHEGKIGEATAISIADSFDGMSRSTLDAKKSLEAKKKADEETTKATVDATLATAGLTDANGKNTESTDKVADSNDILADRMGASTKGINEQAGALGEVVDALKTYYGFAISASDADVSLYDSFDKMSDSIAKNGSTLDLNTEKGRDNQSALNDIASAALKSAEAHARNGDSVKQINPIIDKARSEFVDFATKLTGSKEKAERMADAAGLTKDKINDLATSIRKIPVSKKSTITVSVVGGSMVADLVDQYGRLNQRAATYKEQAAIIASGKVPSAASLFSKRAMGGLINGPGTGTSDDIPAKLSNGEYVVRAAAVKQYGVGMLNAINWQRYAVGGPVKAYQATPLPTKFDHGQGKVTYLQTVNLKMYGTGSSSVDAQRAASRIRASSNALISMNGM